MTVQGFYNVCRDTVTRQDLPRGLFFDQDFGPASSASCRSPRAASMPARCQLLDLFGDEVVLQFGGGTIGHPMGIQAGAQANRVALEAMVLARNEGRDILNEGPDILKAAAEHCRPLRAALDTWARSLPDYTSTDTSTSWPMR
ncbi:MAG: RuBisCO large subunit C-terminal-like domain-containing protein [Rhodocyclaceae bacterium]